MRISIQFQIGKKKYNYKSIDFLRKKKLFNNFDRNSNIIFFVTTMNTIQLKKGWICY